LSAVVLDASALVALLRGESGAPIVAENVRGAAVSAVNFGETAQRQYKAGTSRQEFEDVIAPLNLNIVSVDRAMALDAADIREIARAKSLSQADCICLALAKRMGVVAMTADQKWLEIAGALGVEVWVVR
jgi:ribonuclease VapC